MRNDLKLALRAFSRQKGYAVIHIAGLSLGIAACVLIVLFVRDEMTYDAFHVNADRIFRMHRVPAAESPVDADVAMPMPLGPALAASFPDVEAFVRFDEVDGVTMKRGDSEWSVDRVLFADASVLDVFSFPLQAGRAQAALAEPDAAVLSHEAAERFFGGANAVGERFSLWLGGRYHEFTVTGVADPVPANSSVDFTVLLPFSSRLRVFESARAQVDSWSNSSVITYVLLREPASSARVGEGLAAFTQSHFGALFEGLRSGGFWDRAEPPMLLRLQPLRDIHLNPDVPVGLTSPSSPVYSYILAAVAVGVLFIACVNFTTLAVARSTARAKEVSVRKVVGARRRELMLQFWTESILMSTAAVVAGALLAQAALPLFNAMTGKELIATLSAKMVLVLVAIALVTGLAAGAYPAAYLSRFQPVEVFRRRVRFGRGNRFTRGLVVAQFVVSACLLVGTFVMSNQLDFLQSKTLGFAEDEIVSVPVFRLPDPHFVDRFTLALNSRPEVAGVSGSNVSFTRFSNRMGMTYEGALLEPNSFRVDSDYLTTMGVELGAGRFFDAAHPTDSTQAVVVNEAFVRALGLADPVGSRLTGLQWGALDAPEIIGVVRDFNFSSLHEAVAPVVLSMNPDQRVNYLMVRIRPESASRTVAVLESEWSRIAGDVPFAFSFLDEDLEALYRSERRWRLVIGYASFFAILISAIGLFGLAVLTIRGRTKEIGIRKVLGASATRVASTFSLEFLRLAAMGLIVAAPIAYVAAMQWLDTFAYRVGPEAFALSVAAAGAVIGLTAGLTVGIHAVRAALSDPVDSLKYE